jgi:hypothetical protein
MRNSDPKGHTVALLPGSELPALWLRGERQRLHRSGRRRGLGRQSGTAGNQRPEVFPALVLSRILQLEDLPVVGEEHGLQLGRQAAVGPVRHAQNEQRRRRRDVT